jgi:hypothetical protein
MKIIVFWHVMSYSLVEVQTLDEHTASIFSAEEQNKC